MSGKRGTKRRKKTVQYDRYGYFFILPFFLVYLFFQIYPLINTFYWSVFSYEKRNLKETIAYCGLENFQKVLGLLPGETANFFQYLKNTLVMWVCGFIPQILLSLLLAAWLTNTFVKIRKQGAVKIIMYMPNIITAASVSILFSNLFSQYGPITKLLKSMHIISENFDFMQSVAGSRGLISFILFWMWFGNTTLLLISGMLGIDPSLYEAASIDGANGKRQFFNITLPLLKPILLFTLVTSAVGGLQMYDIPSLFNVTGSSMMGNPGDKTTTVTMYIMRLYSTDVGRAAAISVLLFAVTILFSIVLFLTMGEREKSRPKHAVI